LIKSLNSTSSSLLSDSVSRLTSALASTAEQLNTLLQRSLSSDVKSVEFVCASLRFYLYSTKLLNLAFIVLLFVCLVIYFSEDLLRLSYPHIYVTICRVRRSDQTQ